MKEYVLIKDQDGRLIAIRRSRDNAFIPQDLRNNDYVNFLEWCKQGNTPDEETISTEI